VNGVRCFKRGALALAFFFFFFFMKNNDFKLIT